MLPNHDTARAVWEESFPNFRRGVRHRRPIGGCQALVPRFAFSSSPEYFFVFASEESLGGELASLDERPMTSVLVVWDVFGLQVGG